MTPKRGWCRAAARLAPAILIVCALVACGADGTGDASTAARASASGYSADIKTARSEATSDFEKEVLADNEISQAEYDESVKRYVACMQRALAPKFSRFAATKNEYGFYMYQGPPVDRAEQPIWDQAYQSADQRCRVGTTVLIEPLFVEMLTNPGHVSHDQQVVDCFRRHKLVKQGYSVANYRADLAASRSGKATSGSFDRRKVTGLDLGGDSGPLNECMVTPWKR